MRQWGMIREEAVASGGGRQSFLALLLRDDSETAVAILYMDSKEKDAFGADTGDKDFRDKLKETALVPNRMLICEVGAGKSLLAEILTEASHSLDTLTLADESPSMLDYSRVWEKVGVRLDLASAFSLPYETETFDVVVSCLGDPYNLISFWTEVRRVLKRDGVCLFTTPSWEWAAAFRKITDTDAMHSSAFELADGSQISLPSHIHPEHDQIRLIESANFAISEISHVLIGDLSGQKLSPKLVLQRGTAASIVTGYVARRLDQNV